MESSFSHAGEEDTFYLDIGFGFAFKGNLLVQMQMTKVLLVWLVTSHVSQSAASSLSGRFLARIYPLHFAAQSRQSKFWLCETSMLIKLNIHESFFKSHHWDPQHAFALPLNHIRPSTLAAAKPPNPSASFPDGQHIPTGLRARSHGHSGRSQSW